MLYDSTWIKFKSRPSQTMGLEVRKVMALGRGTAARRGHVVFSRVTVMFCFLIWELVKQACSLTLPVFSTACQR